MPNSSSNFAVSKVPLAHTWLGFSLNMSNRKDACELSVSFRIVVSLDTVNEHNEACLFALLTLVRYVCISYVNAIVLNTFIFDQNPNGIMADDNTLQEIFLTSSVTNCLIFWKRNLRQRFQR